MKRLWFKNVLDLEKGIVSWKESGMKLYTWEESNKEQSEKMRIITVDAQKFAFSPNEIRVKKWENVALFINDIDTDHWAQFEEMDVYYEENGNIILDTSIPWIYKFACATMCGDGHRQMKWVIVVE